MHHWQYLIMGSYLFTIYHASLTMLPSLPLLLPHPPLLSQFCCCSFSPHLPRFPPPFAHHWQCLFLSACFLSVVDGMPGTITHSSFLSTSLIFICLLPCHSFRVPMSILSALILIHDVCCFFFLSLPFHFLCFCLSVLVTLYMLEIGMWVHSV